MILGLPFIPKPKLRVGLQAFYKLSDTSDSSGNNRTLTNNGNVSFASGKIGNAAVFDGSNYLDVLSPQSNWNLTGLTFSAWVKYEDFSPNSAALAQSGREGIAWGVSIRNNKIAINTVDYPNGVAGTEHFLYGDNIDNNWHHVVGVYNGENSFKLFVDGVLKDQKNNLQNIMPSTDHITIGSSSWGEEENMKNGGKVDAVGIWNRALSDAEVALLYNNGNGIEVA